jgi:hypothetical protein
MPQTFIFEELDNATRGYLTKVRDSKGKGMPGMFAKTSSSLAGCGLLAGIGIVVGTLVVTLTTWIDGLRVVGDEPIRAAMLQTAGLVAGGWLILAYFRMEGTKGSERIAGHWVYMDPQNLYVAMHEQVAVTDVSDMEEASFTHNYNNGNYQNSVIKIVLGNGKRTSFTINNEVKAEQFATYVNYLGWARGGSGGEVGNLPPATLGAVARYVAKNDVEPKDSNGATDLSLLELDIEEIPEEPMREGRAAPSILPYIVMVLAAIAIFVVMTFIVNPFARDNAIYSDVMATPTEPRFLRVYLMDSRNTLYRTEVLNTLSSHYYGVIQFVSTKAQQPELRSGMLKILESLRKDGNRPVVSLRVTERSPAKISSGAPDRVKKLREGVVGGDGILGKNKDGILDVFAEVSPPISIPNVTITPPPPAIGHQLIEFVEKPDEAQNAHFEITYEFKPTGDGDMYLLSVTVEIRDTFDGQPIATYTTNLSTYGGDEKSLNKAIDDLKAKLVQWLVGVPDNTPRL